MGLLDAIFSILVAIDGDEKVTRKRVNFVGVTYEDDPANDRMNITMPTAIDPGGHVATSVLGRAAGTTGDAADIAAAADDTVLRRVSGALGWGALTIGMFGDGLITGAKLVANAVTDAKFRQSAAVSVVGRSANSTGDVADIAAGSNDTMLRHVSNALSWGTLTLAMVPDGLLTPAKFNSTVKRVTPYAGRVSAMNNNALATSYAAPFGRNEGASITTTVADGQMRINRSGNLKNFHARCLTSSGDPDTFTLALNVNGSDTALSLSGMAGNDTTWHRDTSNSVAVTADDLLTVAKTNGANATLTDDIVWGFDFEETLT